MEDSQNTLEVKATSIPNSKPTSLTHSEEKDDKIIEKTDRVGKEADKGDKTKEGGKNERREVKIERGERGEKGEKEGLGDESETVEKGKEAEKGAGVTSPSGNRDDKGLDASVTRRDKDLLFLPRATRYTGYVVLCFIGLTLL